MDTDDYFCVGEDGRLYSLGNHGDIEAAFATADSLNIKVIWVFGRDDASDWRAQLDLWLGDDGYPYKYEIAPNGENDDIHAT